MSKKVKEKKESINEDLCLDEIMSDRFGRYSKYIIQERALPDARDGLKPVQRRILYGMHYDNNTADKPTRKCAKTVGLVMGTFHPHGDTSIYDAMIRLSQDWKINLPLVFIQGNNGSIDDDPPAAMRYTEARLSKNADLLLTDIESDTVKMTNNYDDTVLEPTVLPVSIPLLLINGSTGIASGYATNMAPHNLNEVIDATIYRLKHPTCSLDKVMSFIKGPDFPTGGIVQGKDSIRDVFKTGKGRIVLRSKCEIVESKGSKQIIVTEIPYEIVKSSLVKKITDVSLSKDIDGISDVRDESGKNGLKIVIDIKKEANAEMILNYLYKNTDLQIYYNYNNIAIANHRPQLLSLLEILDVFIEHRKEVIYNRSVFLKKKKSEQKHIIEGLVKAISVLDKVIKIIRNSKDKKDAKDKLIKTFKFSDAQAEAIVNLRLYRLTNTDVTILNDELKTLKKEIKELDEIINSKDVLSDVIENDLKNINKNYPTPRKTKIENEVEEIVVDKVSMITNEECYISLSKDGYLKRFSQRAFDSNVDQIPFTKDGDYLIGMRKCETVDTLLVFSSKGTYCQLPVYSIDECRFKDPGKHISSYVKFDGFEKFVGAVLVKSFDTFAFVVTATKNGMVKRTSIPRFELSRTSRPVPCMKLKNGDEMVSAVLSYEEDDLLLISKDGYYNYYSTEYLQDLAPKAQGVAGINVKKDELACAIIKHKNSNEELLITSDKGGFKRIHFSDLSETNRNAKGSRLYKQVKSKPHAVLFAKAVKGNSSIIFKDENFTKFGVSEIPFMDLDSSFSVPFTFDNDAYSFIIDDMNGFEEALIIDIPKGYFEETDSEK